MIAYASRTGTRRNLDALKAAGWRLLLSAKGRLNPLEDGWRYALDNGAWWAFQNGQPFDVAAFEYALSLFGAGADFIVVPDIVEGGLESLAFSERWLLDLSAHPQLTGQTFLIAVQDGMEPGDVAPLLSRSVGVFVGGSTEFKLATMNQWVELAHAHRAHCHIGRVNSAKRVILCDIAGADSFDGSGPAKWEDCLRRVNRGLDQRDLEGAIRRAA